MRRPGAPQVLMMVAVLGLRAQDAGRVGFRGGSLDDQLLARAAAGLRPGDQAPPEGLDVALEGIRATDRFRGVRLEGATIVLDPWPALAGIDWAGDASPRLRGQLFPDLRKGMRLGAQRLESMRAAAQERLQATGYPKAEVQAERGQGDRVRVAIQTGPPNLIKAVEVVGDTGSFSADDLVRRAGVVPGRSLWYRDFELECLKRLRKALVGGHWYEFGRKRYEARADLDWDAGGTLRITVEAGPKVRLKSEGAGLGLTTTLKDMVPLNRSNRYTPELLDEGERRMVRLFRSRGHLDPQVSHKREVTQEGVHGPEEVVVTYKLAPGPVSRLDSISFEGNREVSAEDLRKAAPVKRTLGFWPKARPELMDDLESRVQALYESRGYTDVKIRRSVVQKGGRAGLVLRIREGRRHLVAWVRLDLPKGSFGDPWRLGECLPLLFSDGLVQVRAGEDRRVYHSDRPEMAGVEGELVREGDTLTLRLSKPIPLLKQDFFKVYSAIRQHRLTALGVIRPVVRSQVVEAENGATGLVMEVPDQPAHEVRRVVVRGTDRTRAKAVLREIPLAPGDPVDVDKLGRAQGNLGTLGAFQRVEATSLAENGGEGGPPSPWVPGDLLFRTEERSPWVATHSFGYDRTQGYYFGTGVQRLNLGGMGRTLDFNLRAGDGTLQNPTLRRTFRTGQYTRSLDSYSVGYTDPWFLPGWILPDRSSFRLEGAYIQEQRYIYNTHRRRVLSSIRLPVSSRVNLETGYRFERVDVAGNVPNLSDDDLARIARYPRRATISAPYAQLVRDTRDNAFDPTSGTYSLVRFEAASQFFLTSKNASFLKLDVRNQWTWPVGYKARAGVVAFGVRFGLARPTASTSEDLPLSERFFAGGPGSHRGVEPDYLGPLGDVPKYNPDGTPQQNPDGTAVTETIPLGGQALVIANLEYRFPLFGQTVWGEVFADTGQVYERLHAVTTTTTDGSGNPVTVTYQAKRPPLRTSLGLGLIFKIGIPVKLEYAADVNRILGRPRSDDDRHTQLRNILISAGFQF